MKKTERITCEVRALERMDLHSLRDEWRRRFGQPPKIRSTELLARLLAWRIQADAFGGLDATSMRLLKRQATPQGLLDPGTKLFREWRGRCHEVQVLEQGFGYAGHEYRSLSEVARVITGTRWNGPRFFGLRHGGR
jgi:Protein of unknown function (DUF2924)